MRGLVGKFAIVTGASRGIGKSIALRLVHEGVSVFITAEQMTQELLQSEAACNAAATNIPNVEPGAVVLREEGAAESIVDAAVAAYGSVDILVNNLGIRG